MMAHKLHHLTGALAALLLAGLLWIALSDPAEPASPVQPATAVARASTATQPPTALPARTPAPGPLPAAEEQRIELLEQGGVRASVRRGGLVLELNLPRRGVWAGEVITSVVELRNEGPRQFGQLWSRLAIKAQDGWYGTDWQLLAPNDIAPIVQELAPGAVGHEILYAYVPPESAEAGQQPQLWLSLTFVASDAPLVSHRLEIGPIPLEVSPAPQERQLQAQVAVEGRNWQVQVSGPQPLPEGPFWGALSLRFAGGGATGRPLGKNTHGSWAGGGAETLGGRPATEVRALVTAPGYAAAVVSQTLTLDQNDAVRQRVPTFRVEFDSLADAEQALGFNLLELEQAPPGSVLERIKAFGPNPEHSSVVLNYRLAQGGRLTLFQLRGSEPANTYEPDPQHVAIPGAVGAGVSYQSFGERHLIWRTSELELHLTAPAEQFALEQLVELAGSLR